MPPGAIAYAHIHDGFEVMLYIVQGKVKHTFGEGLTQEVINEAGDFIYIKPGVPHEVFNIGDGPLLAPSWRARPPTSGTRSSTTRANIGRLQSRQLLRPDGGSSTAGREAALDPLAEAP